MGVMKAMIANNSEIELQCHDAAIGVTNSAGTIIGLNMKVEKKKIEPEGFSKQITSKALRQKSGKPKKALKIR